jgi:hypothetical protein
VDRKKDINITFKNDSRIIERRIEKAKLFVSEKIDSARGRICTKKNDLVG